MKISEIMSRNVVIASPDDTLRDAAQAMARIDAGVLPVAENDRLIGMITDRDIAVRAVADGMDVSSAKVRDVMSADVKYCFDDEPVEHIADSMAGLQMRRLPVMSRDKRLVGIVSLGDIATQEKPAVGGQALCGISQPGPGAAGSGAGGKASGGKARR